MVFEPLEWVWIWDFQKELIFLSENCWVQAITSALALQGGSQLELAEIGKSVFTNHLLNQKNIYQEIGESKQTEEICTCFDHIDTSVTLIAV